MSEPAAESVWLITGCSSGFGAAIARAAVARGMLVVATARDPRSIPALGEGDPERVTRLALDVTDRAQREAVVGEVVERFGRVDVLVNNAGRMHLGAVEECSDAELREMFDLQVFAPTDLARLVLPKMREREAGTIVQISSQGAFLVAPGASAYTASKAALEAVSTALSVEVAPFGIRVLIVTPGNHKTAVFSEGRLGGAERLPAYAEVVGGIERMFIEKDGEQAGDPDRAAEVIVDVVGAERAPLRLPLGADAVETLLASGRALEAETLEWADVARKTSR